MKTRSVLISSVILLVSIFTLPISVSASERVPSPDPNIPEIDNRGRILIRQVEIPMVLDCSTVPDTQVAKEFISTNGLCNSRLNLYNNSVSGNCGTLTLNLWNDSLGGHMHWQTVITSSWGRMTRATFSGTWHNYDSGYGSGLTKSGWPNSTYWQKDVGINTGSGYVRGEIITASSRLWWGGQCVAAGAPYAWVLVH